MCHRAREREIERLLLSPSSSCPSLPYQFTHLPRPFVIQLSAWIIQPAPIQSGWLLLLLLLLLPLLPLPSKCFTASSQNALVHLDSLAAHALDNAAAEQQQRSSRAHAKCHWERLSFSLEVGRRRGRWAGSWSRGRGQAEGHLYQADTLQFV